MVWPRGVTHLPANGSQSPRPNRWRARARQSSWPPAATAGSDAAAQIAVSTGNPHVSHILLDLADLESVARAAAGWSGPLHILVNNAGIMAVPELT
jgi:NAD(P)-dependent dehydrogenase (short-subunit alcohol dehydrogenase family)